MHLITSDIHRTFNDDLLTPGVFEQHLAFLQRAAQNRKDIIIRERVKKKFISSYFGKKEVLD